MSIQSRKELKEQYRNREIIGWVYCIICKENGKYWLRAKKNYKHLKTDFYFQELQILALKPA